VCTAAGNPVSDAVGCIDDTSVGNAMSHDAGSYGSRPWMPTSDSEQARVLTYLLSMKFTMRCKLRLTHCVRPTLCVLITPGKLSSAGCRCWIWIRQIETYKEHKVQWDACNCRCDIAVLEKTRHERKSQEKKNHQDHRRDHQCREAVCVCVCVCVCV
jgi:hypothetical protein